MSENVLGKREIIKLNEESAFGTLATGNYMVLNNAVFTPNNTQEFEVIKGKGTDSVVSGREAGVQDVNFTLEFKSHFVRSSYRRIRLMRFNTI